MPPSSQVPRNNLTGEAIFSTLFEYSGVVRTGEICRYKSILSVHLNLLSDICGDETSYIQLLDLTTPIDILNRIHRSPLCLPSDPELSTNNAAAEHIRCVEKVLNQEFHVSSTGLILVLTLNLTYKTIPAESPLKLWTQRIYWQSKNFNEIRDMVQDDTENRQDESIEVYL